MDNLWDELQGVNTFEKVLHLLNFYTTSWNSTHRETIKNIISPYYDEQGERRQDNEPWTYSIRFLMHQISRNIQKENIKSGGLLDKILDVIKKRTGIYISDYYKDDVTLFSISIERLDILLVEILLKSKNINLNETYILNNTLLFENKNNTAMTLLQYAFKRVMHSPYTNHLKFLYKLLSKCIAYDHHCLDGKDSEGKSVNDYRIMLEQTVKKDSYQLSLISELFYGQQHFNKALFFMMTFGSQSCSSLFYLPVELIYLISDMIVKSYAMDESMYSPLLVRLLKEYCSTDNTERNLEKAYQKEIGNILEIHINLINRLFLSAGHLLYRISKEINFTEVSKNDELYYVFKKLFYYTSGMINIVNFYPNTPLISFLDESGDDVISSECLISFILNKSKRIDSKNDDIKLFFSHPYFDLNGKKAMVNSFLENCGNGIDFYTNTIDINNDIDQIGLLMECDPYLEFSQQEYADKVLEFISNNCANFALYFFCRANHLGVPEVIFYEDDLERIEILEVMLLQINKPVDSLIIMSVIKKMKSIWDSLPGNNVSEIDLDNIKRVYQLLLSKKEWIANGDLVLKSYISCFTLGLVRYFAELMIEDKSGSNTEVKIIQLLPDFKRYIEIASKSRAVGGLFNFAVANSFYNLAIQLYYPANTFMRPVYVQKLMDVSTDDVRRDLNLMSKKESCFNQVATFFSGSHQYDAASQSMVSELPNNVVEKIGVMTIKSCLG